MRNLIRRLSALAVILALLGLVTGCAPSKPSNPAGNVRVAVQQFEAGEVAKLQAYQASHPGELRAPVIDDDPVLPDNDTVMTVTGPSWFFGLRGQDAFDEDARKADYSWYFEVTELAKGLLAYPPTTAQPSDPAVRQILLQRVYTIDDNYDMRPAFRLDGDKLMPAGATSVVYDYWSIREDDYEGTSVTKKKSTTSTNCPAGKVYRNGACRTR